MTMRPQRRAAGRGAAQKYQEMRRRWLRRTRRHWVFVGSLLGALALMVNLSLIWLPPKYAWTAGAITGMLASLFLAARSEPPSYIENWLIGSWGEEQTEKVLRPLEADGWRVHHDLPGAYGNWDHVVVGPGGVFLLDSKKFQGEVEVQGDQALVRRLEDPELTYRFDAAKKIIPLAMEVRDHLRAATRATQYVQAVVVVWGRFPAGVAGERCKYVHGDRLSEWLREQPQRVAPERVDQFSAALCSGDAFGSGRSRAGMNARRGRGHRAVVTPWSQNR